MANQQEHHFCNIGLQKTIFRVMTFLIIMAIIISGHWYRNYNSDLKFKQTTLLTEVRSGKWDSFQKIDHNFIHFYVFNAFDDYRSNTRLLRILTLGNPQVKVPLYCHILFADKSIVLKADANFERILPQQKQMRVEGFFLRCPFRSTDPPHFVSVSTSEAIAGANLLRIHRLPRPLPPPPPTTAACVAPLHDSVSAAPMAEWIETNRLLGVSHFIFYNFSVPPDLSRLLRHYQRLGVATVIPWLESSIPFPVMKKGWWPPVADKLHYFGQFFTFNDCLYRRLNRQRFLLFIDVDELAVPYADATLTAYLQRMTSRTSNLGAVLLRNVYFLKEKGEDQTLGEEAKRLLTITKFTWRMGKSIPPPSNSKIATIGDRVLVMHVHGTGAMWSYAKMVWADEKEACLHHYKNNMNETGHKPSSQFRIERRIFFVVQEVVKRVKQVLHDSGIGGTVR